MLKYLYLLGYPLGHSISPAMQNAALRACGLDGIRYVTKPMPPDKMREMIAALRAPDCLGANATVPHKQSILPHLDGLTEQAREIGAVNTVVKRAGAGGKLQLIGENTDAYGLAEALKVAQVTIQETCAVILGAGGAAAAAGHVLAEGGVRELVLLNRTPERGVELADRLNGRFPRLMLAINDWSALERARLVINATSVGMMPHAEESPLPENCVLARGATVFDLVYNPPTTRLLRDAQKQGARAIGGLEMLIYQGARAFELWTGQKAPLDVMRAAATSALEKSHRKKNGCLDS
jgi:shikimate dehydrogenase